MTRRLVVIGPHHYAFREFFEKNNLDPREHVTVTHVLDVQGLRFTFNDVVLLEGWSKLRDIEEIMEIVKRNNVIMTPKETAVTECQVCERELNDFSLYEGHEPNCAMYRWILKKRREYRNMSPRDFIKGPNV